MTSTQATTASTQDSPESKATTALLTTDKPTTSSQLTVRPLGFLGCGNMGSAIVAGLLQAGYPANQLFLCNQHPEKLAHFAQQGVTLFNQVDKFVQNLQAQQAAVLVLAIKPQMVAQVCSQLDFSGLDVISLAAGISCDRLSQLLPNATNYCRVMPNTPSLVGLGMAGIYAPGHASALASKVEPNAQVEPSAQAEPSAQLLGDFAYGLMQAVGKAEFVRSEDQINQVIACAGSAPAYFFLLMEALEQAMIARGMPAAQAQALIAQTALGAATMATKRVVAGGESFAQLRQNVTSKGGTTAAALGVFEGEGIRETVAQAVEACIARAEEMEKLF